MCRTPLIALLLISAVIATSSAPAAGGSTQPHWLTSTLKPLHITGRVLRAVSSRASSEGTSRHGHRRGCLEQGSPVGRNRCRGTTASRRIRRSGQGRSPSGRGEATEAPSRPSYGSGPPRPRGPRSPNRFATSPTYQAGAESRNAYRSRCRESRARAVRTATGNDGTSGHNIIFADGPFTYHVGVGWGMQVKDPPTRAQLIAAATTLYKRVHGRPAP